MREEKPPSLLEEGRGLLMDLGTLESVTCVFILYFWVWSFQIPPPKKNVSSATEAGLCLILEYPSTVFLFSIKHFLGFEEIANSSRSFGRRRFANLKCGANVNLVLYCDYFFILEISKSGFKKTRKRPHIFPIEINRMSWIGSSPSKQFLVGFFHWKKFVTYQIGNNTRNVV